MAVAVNFDLGDWRVQHYRLQHNGLLSVLSQTRISGLAVAVHPSVQDYHRRIWYHLRECRQGGIRQGTLESYGYHGRVEWYFWRASRNVLQWIGVAACSGLCERLG